VQHGPVLGGVDVCAGEHRVAALLELGRAGQIDQQTQRFPGHPMLAVVDVQIPDRHRQFAPAARIFGEQFPKMFAGDLVVMAAQRGPLRGGGNVGGHS
jgi:hypothetical protein